MAKKTTLIIGAAVGLTSLACMVSRSRRLAREVAAETEAALKENNGAATTKTQPVHSRKPLPDATKKAATQQRGKSVGRKPKGMSDRQWRKEKKRRQDMLAKQV